MKSVAKYNIFKLISMLLTFGTPAITAITCSDLIIKQSDTAISSAGMITILIVALIMKDKIAENFKMPSAFIVSLIGFILIILIQSIIEPMKAIFLATMISTGVDEVTFKHFYKNIELALPESCKSYKHCGFIFTSTNKLKGENSK